MQIEIITYYVASGNPKPGFEWTAYVVLPNGEYWGVRFNGSTEEIAKTKAIALWAKENAKWERLGLNKQQEEDEEVPLGRDITGKPVTGPHDPWASSGRGHHFAGKVWMRHETEGLKRVALTEIALYEKNGYVRGGPRGK